MKKCIIVGQLLFFSGETVTEEVGPEQHSEEEESFGNGRKSTRQAVPWTRAQRRK